MSTRYTLEIDMGNAAFDEFPQEEVARILAAAAAKVQLMDPNELGDFRPLHDINGNRVGTHGFVDPYK